MKAKPMPKPNQLKTAKLSAESVVKDIRRQTRARPSSRKKSVLFLRVSVARTASLRYVFDTRVFRAILRRSNDI
jgi:hypothetical protein